MTSHLLLPIETMSRELDGRLLLAAAYAHAGHRVFVGAPLMLAKILPELRGGLYLGKHIFYPHFSDAPPYRLAKRQGFRLLHLAEEGGVFMGGQNDWRADLDFHLDPKVIAPDDYICTWGDFQRAHYLKQGAANASHVRTTGHPRFELCKPRYAALYGDDVGALRARYGRFVLFNSSFSAALDPEGARNTFSAACGYVPEDEQARLRSSRDGAAWRAPFPSSSSSCTDWRQSAAT